MSFDFEKCVRVASNLLSAKWKFARTAAKANPHWYSVRTSWENDDEFFEAVQHVRRHGKRVVWGSGLEFIVLNINHHRFWTMGCPIRPASSVPSGDCNEMAAVHFSDGGYWKTEANGDFLINRCVHEDVLESVYDEFTSNFYDQLFSGSKYRDEDIRIGKAIGTLSGSVLDIGCGTGAALGCCDLDPERYTGVDPSVHMLKRLAVKYPAVRKRLFQSSYEDFYTVNQETFDNAICLYGTGSYINPEYWRKLPHQLSEGGRFFLMFYKDDYKPAIDEMAGVEFPTYPGAWNCFPDRLIGEFGSYVVVQGKKEDVEFPVPEKEIEQYEPDKIQSWATRCHSCKFDCKRIN